MKLRGIFVLFLIFGLLLSSIPGGLAVASSSETWNFSKAADYTYDNTKVDLSSGTAAVLKATTTPWYDNNWGYRIPITIDNSQGSAMTDYVAAVNLPNSSFNYLGAKSDGSDIYFTDTDGKTPLSFSQDYWKVTTLPQLGTRTVPVPAYIYTTGNAIGNLTNSSGNEIIAGYGSDLFATPVSGTVYAFDSSGNIIWSHNSPSTDYPMGMAIGDVDNDGTNEVAVGFRLIDHRGELLDNNGNLKWYYDLGANNYVRIARIGQLRTDYSGNQVLFGGANGQLALLSATGTAIWTKTICSGCTLQSARIADVNNDGQNDIVLSSGVVGGGDGEVRLLDKNGNISWSTHISTGDVMGVAVGDLTSDPGLEIVAPAGRYSTQSGVTLLKSDGTILWTKNFNFDYNDWSAEVGDIDGSGQNKIIIGYGNHDTAAPSSADSGGVLVLDKNGNLLDNIALPSSIKMMSIGDVNGDGINDIVASCDDGKVYLISGSSSNYSSLFKVRIPSISAGEVKTIYMYYGNSSATSASDTNAQYSAAYDFTGVNGTLPSGWTNKIGSWSIQNNQLQSPSDGNTGNVDAVNDDNDSPQNFVLTMDTYKVDAADNTAFDYYLGFYYRVQSWSGGLPNAYRFQIGKKGNYYLQLVAAGSSAPVYTLATGTNGPIFSTTDKLSLRLIVSGDTHTIEYKLNDASTWTRLLSYTDTNASKISTAGTIALENNKGQTNFDNVQLTVTQPSAPTVSNSSENTLYSSDNPTVVPTQALTFTSLSGFTETATKNGGEIKYQLSNDGGTTWYWWNGSAWVTTVAGYTEASLASDINTNISSFPVGSGSFLFKAYLHSDGAQLVQLNSVNVSYGNGSSVPPSVPAPNATSLSYSYGERIISKSSQAVSLAQLQSQLQVLLTQLQNLRERQLSISPLHSSVSSQASLAQALGYDFSPKILQRALNSLGYKVASSGPGSPGHETNIFGFLTRAALIKFQVAQNVISSATSPGAGVFGPKSKAKLLELLK